MMSRDRTTRSGNEDRMVEMFSAKPTGSTALAIQLADRDRRIEELEGFKNVAAGIRWMARAKTLEVELAAANEKIAELEADLPHITALQHQLANKDEHIGTLQDMRDMLTAERDTALAEVVAANARTVEASDIAEWQATKIEELKAEIRGLEREQPR